MKKFEKSHPEQQLLEQLNVFNWNIWDSPPPPGFEWEYEEKVMAYIIEGDATVTSEGETLSVGEGDLLIIHPGAGKCHWDVKKKVKSHFRFP
jgi:uncharacterized cupin superfamily protein